MYQNLAGLAELREWVSVWVKIPPEQRADVGWVVLGLQKEWPGLYRALMLQLVSVPLTLLQNWAPALLNLPTSERAWLSDVLTALHARAIDSRAALLAQRGSHE